MIRDFGVRLFLVLRSRRRAYAPSTRAYWSSKQRLRFTLQHADLAEEITERKNAISAALTVAWLAVGPTRDITQ